MASQLLEEDKKESRYRNFVDPGSKNGVFVTEVDRDEEDAKKFITVVDQSGHVLIKDSRNTQQRTLVLSKEKELAGVNQEMKRTRQACKERMDACELKRQELMRKQQSLRDQMIKFDKFISDNEYKRKNAVAKFNEVSKEQIQLSEHHDRLCENLAELQNARDRLKRRLAHHAKFARFLQAAISILPEDYLDTSADNKIDALMRRHATLADWNGFMRINSSALRDQLDSDKAAFDKIMETHTQKLMGYNGELKQLNAKNEKLRESNKMIEERKALNLGSRRKDVTEQGNVMKAVENLVSKIEQKEPDAMTPQHVFEKLDAINDLISGKRDIVEYCLSNRFKRNSTTIKEDPCEDETTNT